nr:sulfite exporter TauE/SafE family protein [Kibdelosporangium sp. MJ126-NF4]CEL18625.1 Membrane protein [Kibdelosporangium sp. MJ126-NF4]CTQ98110.1 Membrane protein [Kibdelosporangium sp. MJ126-NF4]
MIAVVLLAPPVGLLIGAIGIGGVLLPPALTWLGGLDAHTAAGTSSWCFLFTGLVGTAMYARQRTVAWRLAGLLTVGAAPAAVGGAAVNVLLPAQFLRMLLALLVLGVGVHQMWFRSGASGDRVALPAFGTVLVGAVVGFGSALTGTGGPVLLVPLLLALGVQPLTTIAVAQVISLPLVGFAVLGYSAHGYVHFGLGSLLGVLAGVGALVGSRLVLGLARQRLHRVVSVAMVAFGVVLLAGALVPVFLS